MLGMQRLGGEEISNDVCIGSWISMFGSARLTSGDVMVVVAWAVRISTLHGSYEESV